ncbi:MAG: hypothetical protein Tsb0014_04870 [Pleurocapsa sp.]
MKKYFTTFVAISALTLFAIGTKFLTQNANAQSSARPYVVLVNGYENCCVWSTKNSEVYMEIILKELEERDAEFRLVSWDNFSNEAGQRSSTSNDATFLREATNFINNKLDPDRPLILIGHSFGGDFLLSLAPRIERRIQFLGVIDPTAADGWRQPVTSREVPSNVDYFFNRWQKSTVTDGNVFPFDNRLFDGFISDCRAKNCDQQEQSIARKEDGSEIEISCLQDQFFWKSNCPDRSGILFNATIAKKLSHNDMPSDAYLQRQMTEQISRSLALTQN